jgi:hypothetical protein
MLLDYFLPFFGKWTEPSVIARRVKVQCFEDAKKDLEDPLTSQAMIVIYPLDVVIYVFAS